MLRASFFKWTGGLRAGSTQSKQWRIELIYRYKRAKTSRITVLNIKQLYLYTFLTLNCMSALVRATRLWNTPQPKEIHRTTTPSTFKTKLKEYHYSTLYIQIRKPAHLENNFVTLIVVLYCFCILLQ